MLWRYIDFTKFVSMLDKGGLYFPNAASLNDPFEGSVPRRNYEARIVQIIEEFHAEEPYKKHFVKLFTKYGATGDVGSAVTAQVRHKIELRDKLLAEAETEDEALQKWIAENNAISSFTYHFREVTYITCWHKSEHESAAMWSLYAAGSNNVAITSTETSFRESLPEKVRIAPVKYVDFNTHEIPQMDRPDNNPGDLYFYKRISFAHEQEIRGIFTSHDQHPDRGTIRYGEPQRKLGEWISVDLNHLIDRVIVSPFSEQWYYDLVNSVANKYGLDCEVARSAIEDDPFH